MLFHDETSLAWALTEAITPHLGTTERIAVHVALGVGETYAAIHYLVTSAADNRIDLPVELVDRCTRWLDAYAGHDDEYHLRGLVEYVLARRPSESASSTPSRQRTESEGEWSLVEGCLHALRAE
jgi:hypothetical protein